MEHHQRSDFDAPEQTRLVVVAERRVHLLSTPCQACDDCCVNARRIDRSDLLSGVKVTHAVAVEVLGWAALGRTATHRNTQDNNFPVAMDHHRGYMVQVHRARVHIEDGDMVDVGVHCHNHPILYLVSMVLVAVGGHTYPLEFLVCQQGNKDVVLAPQKI